MPIRLGRVTLPLVGSNSPVRILMNVDLPAPFGPVTAYRRPAIKVVVTSSNKTRPPKRIVTFSTEIITLQFYRETAHTHQIKHLMLGGLTPIVARHKVAERSDHEEIRCSCRPF